MSVQLFKDGNLMAIQTDCQDEDEFTRQFSELLDALIADGAYKGDWDFQFSRWLPQYAELCCAYRGYKCDVQKKIVFLTGDRTPGETPGYEIDDRMNVAPMGPTPVDAPVSDRPWCKKHEHVEPCLMCEEDNSQASE